MVKNWIGTCDKTGLNKADFLLINQRFEDSVERVNGDMNATDKAYRVTKARTLLTTPYAGLERLCIFASVDYACVKTIADTLSGNNWIE